MKTFIAAVALATLVAPAFAQAPSTSVPAPGVTNPHAVFGLSGTVIGVDPDPAVRFEILRDIAKPYK